MTRMQHTDAQFFCNTHIGHMLIAQTVPDK